jgi:hypothetical protein
LGGTRSRKIKRKRPRTFVADPRRHAALRRKWRLRLPSLITDLSDLLGKRALFRDLQEVARQNPKVLSPGAFFSWMTVNYLTAVNIGVRRLTDTRADVRSLWRLLYEVLGHPGVVNRRANRTIYGDPTVADLSFDNIAGRGRSVLAQRIVRSDLRAIEDASERVRRFTNKRIAHHAAPGSLRKLPTYSELDRALDALDRILCKYNTLLTAGGLSTAHATSLFTWQEVLFEPWIPPGNPLRGPA